MKWVILSFCNKESMHGKKNLYLMKVILFQPQQDTISVKDSQSTGEATTPASCKGRVATYPEK